MTMNDLEILKQQQNYISQVTTIELSERKHILKKLYSIIQENLQAIQQALYNDLHKSPTEAYMTEIGMVLSEISYCLKHIKTWTKPQKVTSSILLFPSKARIYPQAKGVVLIISPWNYPFQLSLIPLVGAIAAGNTVILSPSTQSVETNKILQTLINQNFPSTQIYCTNGNKESSTNIIKQGINHLFFTGSYTTAKYLQSLCSEKLVPTTFELGGKSPLIVDKDANINLAVKRIVLGKFINCGQTCIAPDYLFIHKDIKTKFIESLKTQITNTFGNNPLQSENYGRIINEKQYNRLQNLLSQGEIIYGGQTSESQKYISPTLIIPHSLETNLMQDEIFGPILPIIEYQNIEQVIQFINSRPHPLALYYFGTQNTDIIHKTISGGCCINDTIMHIIPHKLPFGGIQQSGMGSYHGKKSFETFSHYKSVLKTNKNFEFNFKYPPYTNFKQRVIKIFLR